MYLHNEARPLDVGGFLEAISQELDDSGYSALHISCLAGVVKEQLSMSLYKLIASASCTITELST